MAAVALGTFAEVIACLERGVMPPHVVAEHVDQVEGWDGGFRLRRDEFVPIFHAGSVPPPRQRSSQR